MERFAYFSIKYYIIFYILTKCFTNLEKRYPHFALFASFFDSWTRTNFLWTQLQHPFQNVLIIPQITPQISIFGFTDHKLKYHLINHILLIFTHYAYKTRENGSVNLKVLKRNVHKIKDIEKQISLNKPKKQKHWTKMESIVRKHIARDLKYMVVQHLGLRRGNIVVFFFCSICCWFLC